MLFPFQQGINGESDVGCPREAGNEFHLTTGKWRHGGLGTSARWRR